MHPRFHLDWRPAGPVRGLGRLTRAGLAAVTLMLTCVAVAPAAAANLPPTLIVDNLMGNNVTTYPLSASGDPKPSITLSSSAASSFAGPATNALDSKGDLWVALANSGDVVEFTASQLAAGNTQTPAVTLTATGGGLQLPAGIAFDAHGDLWVSSELGNTVVEFTPQQLAAGGSQTPAVTISNSGSSVSNPVGISFDATGDLWVANAGQNSVVEFTPAQLGASGSPAPAATLTLTGSNLMSPLGVTFDARGDLWVTTESNTIAEFTPSQLVTGTPSPEVLLTADSTDSIDQPGAAQFDATGDLWVTNASVTAGTPSIVEFNPTELAKSGSPTPVDTIGGANTGLAGPWGLAIEQPPVISAIDTGSGPAGSKVTIHGGGFYPGSTVEFGGTPATSVTFAGAHELTAVAPAGSGTVDVTVTTGGGTSSTGPADRYTYSSAPGVAPTIVVSNGNNDDLESFSLSASGDTLPVATVSTTASQSLDTPTEVALDPAGDVWVPNLAGSSVVEYTPAQVTAGGDPAPAQTITADKQGSLDGPTTVAFDAAGDLWVSNLGNSTLVEYTHAQLSTGGALTPPVTISDDGANSLDEPVGLRFDAAGDLWVANFKGNTVVEYTPGQLVHDGNPTPAVTLSDDGAGSLDGPAALAFDAAGDLWVSDTTTVVEFTPAQLTTGSPTPAVTLSSDLQGSIDNPTQAQFDAAGDLWLANFGDVSGVGSNVVEFTPGELTASGAPMPADTIAGSASGLAGTYGLVIEQAPGVSSITPSSGAPTGTTSVTITGTGFTPSSTVDFGATPATAVISHGPTELTVIAPAGTGTVDVTVTTGEGTSVQTAADRFTYAAATLGTTTTTTGATATTAATTSTITTSTTTSTSTTTKTVTRRPRIALGGSQISVSAGTAAVALSCSVSACQGTVTLTVRRTVQVRQGHRTTVRHTTVTLGTARYRLAAGHRTTLKVKLSSTARGLVAGASHHRLAAQLAATVTGGSTLHANVTLTQQSKPARIRAAAVRPLFRLPGSSGR